MALSTLRHFLSNAPSVFALTAIAALISAQAPESKKADQPSQIQKSPTIYEDREIKLRIPMGWRIAPNLSEPRVNSPNEPPGRLVLEKDGYELSLGYHQGRASGIVGGRFIEAFAINWPGLEDEWTCSMYLKEYPQPASREFVFVNLTVDTGDEKVRENCAIKRNLGYWTLRNGVKVYEGELRWFGGYFREAYGGYFFGSNEEGCAEKAYTLTSQAHSPNRLPIAENPLPENNPALERLIEEAIDIVNSIRYKRCSPFNHAAK